MSRPMFNARDRKVSKTDFPTARGQYGEYTYQQRRLWYFARSLHALGQLLGGACPVDMISFDRRQDGHVRGLAGAVEARGG